MSENNYGKLKAGFGTPDEKELSIINFMTFNCLDNRHITFAEVENNQGYLIKIENLESSGRNPIITDWLSKETFMALIATAPIYMEAVGIDMVSEIPKVLTPSSDNNLPYTCSDNLIDNVEKLLDTTLGINYKII